MTKNNKNKKDNNVENSEQFLGKLFNLSTLSPKRLKELYDAMPENLRQQFEPIPSHLKHVGLVDPGTSPGWAGHYRDLCCEEIEVWEEE